MFRCDIAECEAVCGALQAAKRALKNKALGYLSALNDPKVSADLLERARSATNMTDQIAALAGLCDSDCERSHPWLLCVMLLSGVDATLLCTSTGRVMIGALCRPRKDYSIGRVLQAVEGRPAGHAEVDRPPGGSARCSSCPVEKQVNAWCGAETRTIARQCLTEFLSRNQ